MGKAAKRIAKRAKENPQAQPPWQPTSEFLAFRREIQTELDSFRQAWEIHANTVGLEMQIWAHLMSKPECTTCNGNGLVALSEEAAADPHNHLDEIEECPDCEGKGRIELSASDMIDEVQAIKKELGERERAKGRVA